MCPQRRVRWSERGREPSGAEASRTQTDRALVSRRPRPPLAAPAAAAAARWRSNKRLSVSVDEAIRLMDLDLDLDLDLFGSQIQRDLFGAA